MNETEWKVQQLEQQVADLTTFVDQLRNAGLDRLVEGGYIQFDGIGVRLNKLGLQFDAPVATAANIYWVNGLQLSPATALPRSELVGSSSPTPELFMKSWGSDGADYGTVYAGQLGTSSEALIQAVKDGVGAIVDAYVDTSESYVRVAGQFRIISDISPAQITANQDNYNPTDRRFSSVLRLSTDAARDITGITGGLDGTVLILLNVGSFNITLKDDTTSTAANRFQLNGDIVLGPDESAWLWYDSTSSRWRA